MEYIKTKNEPRLRAGTGYYPFVIRDATLEDIPAILGVHEQAFPETVMVQLGRDYLKMYYRNGWQCDGTIALVAEIGNEIVGYASGSVQPEKFYRKMVRNSWRMAGTLLRGLMRRPSLLASVPYSIGRVFRSTRTVPADCELSFIAVRADAAGNGIGKELGQRFLEKAWEKGAHAVHLTTQAESNDATNGFYASLGFEIVRTFRQCGGCLTNEYIYPSRSSQRSGVMAQ